MRRNNMFKLFTKHPHSIGESYWQHMGFALSFGGQLLMGGMICLVHAIFPFMFKDTGGKVLLDMATRFISRMPRIDGHLQALQALEQILKTKKSARS